VYNGPSIAEPVTRRDDFHVARPVIRLVLSSYFTAAQITSQLGATPEINLRFERTSPLAIGRKLGPGTGDNVPLSLDDAHSEKDY